ncbi:MAG: trehalose-phosphatase [Burkholderiaceae bacterium]|nr:trehalose-phosphatase [Burkholderiaceae bacterium]
MKKTRPGPPPPPSLTWAYFLDVDGTLIHLADTPQAVVVDRPLLDLIASLHRASGGALALVSGRMISDLQSRIGMSQLPLAGLHGLERRDSAGRLWIHAAPPAAKSAIKEALAPVLARHPGLLLEDKGLTLALHYRLAPRLAAYVHQLMGGFVNVLGQGLELQRGKCVVEIKPAGIDKGTAVAEYLTEPPFKGRRPVFIGDDLNDEHGFAEVNRLDGISIKVGKGPSCARFRLSDVAAVHRWLGEALKHKKDRGNMA